MSRPGKVTRPWCFLHGFACNRTFLAPQMEHFAAGRRVVSVDFLGHGDSDKPEREYRIPGFAAEVARLLEHLKLSGVVVVGHSMGGSVALELAAGWPELVRSAVSIDSTIISSVERKAKALPAMLRSLEGPPLPDGRAALCRKHGFAQRRRDRQGARGGGDVLAAAPCAH